MIPVGHQSFVDALLRLLQADDQYCALAVGGSWMENKMDRFSDIDLVIVHTADTLPLAQRQSLAGAAGNLLASFTGEHVGEPRLLICLYDTPLLHVDLKFVALPDMHTRVEDPLILWERDGQLTKIYTESHAKFPYPDYQWLEDRFWIWTHYAATKIGRGELFETLAFLSYIQQVVLGPLALIRHGHLPKGVRKLEQHLPESDLQALKQTLATYDRRSLLKAVHASVAYYKELRDAVMPGTLQRNTRAEQRVLAYLQEIA
jgi:hypothetical protein